VSSLVLASREKEKVPPNALRTSFPPQSGAPYLVRPLPPRTPNPALVSHIPTIQVQDLPNPAPVAFTRPTTPVYSSGPRSASV